MAVPDNGRVDCAEAGWPVPRTGANLLYVASFVERVVQRLREERGFSRNRHYLALSSPEGRKALRIHRHLRSIESDLSGGCAAEVRPEGERICLTLRVRGGTRVAFLTLAEFRLLCTSPVVRAALGESAAEA
jgi:hypothetical protein